MVNHVGPLENNPTFKLPPRVGLGQVRVLLDNEPEQHAHVDLLGIPPRLGGDDDVERRELRHLELPLVDAGPADLLPAPGGVGLARGLDGRLELAQSEQARGELAPVGDAGVDDAGGVERARGEEAVGDGAERRLVGPGEEGLEGGGVARSCVGVDL